MSHALYLDNHHHYGLTPDLAAIRVQSEGMAERLIPLQRVNRIVVKAPADGLLKIFMHVIRQGGVVHLQDGTGHLQAVIQTAAPNASPWANQFVETLDCLGDVVPYHVWLNIQKRHAWAIIVRHDIGIANHQKYFQALEKYASRGIGSLVFQSEMRKLRTPFQSWLHHELIKRGGEKVAHSLMNHGINFLEDLRRIMRISLIWKYASWRKCQKAYLDDKALIRFFEDISESLEPQLNRHIAALAYHYRNSHTRLLKVRGKTGLDDLYEEPYGKP
jgi:hypothetical protein